MKSKRPLYMVGGLLLLAFGGYALASFRSSMVHYVSFDQASRTSKGVQVAGSLEQGTTSYDMDQHALRFTIREPETGKTLRIRYNGVKPGNFEDAVSVVAIGRYDAAAGELKAEKLLVKCPSKYQGNEVQGNEVEEKVYG
jgi:cytochrome c-type biogenesis protein CcmE